MSPHDYEYYSSGKILLATGERVSTPSTLEKWHELQETFIGKNLNDSVVYESIKEINKRYAEWTERDLKSANKSRFFDITILRARIQGFEDRWQQMAGSAGKLPPSASKLSMPSYNSWNQDHQHLVEKAKSALGLPSFETADRIWKAAWDVYYASSARDQMSFQNFIDERWRQSRGYDIEKKPAKKAKSKIDNNNEHNSTDALRSSPESDQRPKGTAISRDEREESAIKDSGGLHGDPICIIRRQVGLRYSSARASVLYGEYPKSEIKSSRIDKR